MKEKQLQQKKKRILWGWILAVLLLSISMGTVNVQASKLKLNKTKITVYKGCTETLKVKISPGRKKTRGAVLSASVFLYKAADGVYGSVVSTVCEPCRKGCTESSR